MKQPLFIVCPGRSFSSVVCAAIGQHPDAFGLPEVNLFVKETIGELTDMEVPLLGVPGIASGLRRAVAELKFGSQTDETVAQANAWIASRRDWASDRMFRELCELASPRRVIEKSPTNSGGVSLQRLLAAFPDAYYLHLSRHPRATSRSQRKAFSDRAWTRELTDFDHERHWFDRHAALVDIGNSLPAGQYMFLQGEWFFEDPALILRQICEWLELSTDNAAIEMMMKPELSPFAVEGPANARLGNNKGFIENPALRIGKIKAETLDAPLEWIEGREAYFRDRTRSLANIMGYFG